MNSKQLRQYSDYDAVGDHLCAVVELIKQTEKELHAALGKAHALQDDRLIEWLSPHALTISKLGNPTIDQAKLYAYDSRNVIEKKSKKKKAEYEFRELWDM